MTNTRTAITLAFAALVALPSRGQADPGAAQPHIDRATTAFGEGRFADALAELEEAYKLDPQPQLLFAIGQAHSKLHQCDQATDAYNKFLATDAGHDASNAVAEAIKSCVPEAKPPAPPPPPPPPASPPPPAAVIEESPKESGVLAGVKLGGFVPLDGLSPFVSFGIELGYRFGHLAVVVDVDYTQPTKTGSESDPRVMGGSYTWKLTEQELGLMPVLLYRLGSGSIVPFAGIGPRILFTKSTVRDNGMPTIAETTEQSTRIGVGIPLGAELAAGPGRFIGEVLLQYGTLDHVATGDANTGALSLSLGYRMMF